MKENQHKSVEEREREKRRGRRENLWQEREEGEGRKIRYHGARGGE